jgi:hypothetical protein
MNRENLLAKLAEEYKLARMRTDGKARRLMRLIGKIDPGYVRRLFKPSIQLINEWRGS